METLFWIFLLTIVYAYFGYPLSIFLLSLLVKNTIREGDARPAVTFLITVYNEKKSIREKLENTLALEYPKDKLQVMVASDASDDGTDDIVRQYAGRGVQLFGTRERVGKTEAQNRAVALSRGEVIVFSDGTTRYESSALLHLVKNYADPAVGAVGGRFRYTDPSRTSVGTGTRAFWDYESIIKLRQTRIRTITGCSGCIYSVRKALYEPLPSDIVSDLVEPLKIIEKGYRVVFEARALAYENTYQRRGDEFRTRIRVISRGMRGILYMKKLLNPFRYPFVSFQLISHKILRWTVPLLAVALYLVNGALLGEGGIYLVFFVLQAVFYLLAALSIVIDFL
ncbi:MAG: glycosyltransferase family 2 protein, partial [Endomicrobiales bacterium]